MVRHGIKDKVAVIGVDATKFGEHYDKGQYDLLANTSTTGVPAISRPLITLKAIRVNLIERLRKRQFCRIS